MDKFLKDEDFKNLLFFYDKVFSIEKQVSFDVLEQYFLVSTLLYRVLQIVTNIRATMSKFEHVVECS
jgi:hypothetical protein